MRLRNDNIILCRRHTSYNANLIYGKQLSIAVQPPSSAATTIQKQLQPFCDKIQTFWATKVLSADTITNTTQDTANLATGSNIK